MQISNAKVMGLLNVQIDKIRVSLVEFYQVKSWQKGVN